MDTEQNPVSNWGQDTIKQIKSIHAKEVDAGLRKLADRMYHKGHLDGFLLGMFAGLAIGVAVMGVLFV